MTFPPHSSTNPSIRGRRGVALVIVLAMVVLVTGLVVAFFSRAITSRQVSNSSAAQTKADLLAQSAADSIVGDFKTQIALSSSTVPGVTSTIYLTSSNTGMVPTRYGIFATSGTAPNLICYSTRTGTSNLTGGGNVFITGSASPVNSGTDVSVNGISVSPTRWNSHYLLPLSPSNPINTIISTPIQISGSTFAPDWVYVTRGGPAVLGSNSYTLGSSATSINNPIASNTNYVVGRYAYAVYDEGGLLDMNVAGYPQNLANTQAAAYKSSLALADLKQVGLSTADINNIVGWRNYASGKATGDFPGGPLIFSDTTSWINNFVLTNTTGYLSTGTLTNSGFTDQAFLSRQQLIKMFTQALPIAPGSAGLSSLQSALQYLSTFSRSLEQPSFVLNPNVPGILAGTPPAATNVDTYKGNNVLAGSSRQLASINLSGSGFLSASVSGSFTRINGSPAVVGEPLVKTKFPLSRLALVSSTATNTINSPQAGETGDKIYDNFGLYRASLSAPWTYNHDPQNRGVILSLSQVAALNREPDFVELLAAAINAGSLGKAAANAQGNNYEYTNDVSVSYQILQIAANLIDQCRVDNYPLIINFTNSAGNPCTIYGVQDLPYFYRWHFFRVATVAPTTLLAGTDSVTFKNFSANGDLVMGHTRTTPSVVANSGVATMMIIPELWNPHAQVMPSTPINGPTTFRVSAMNNDPNNEGTWSQVVRPGSGGAFDGSTVGANPGPPASTEPSASSGGSAVSQTPITLGTGNSWVQFTDATGGRAFREPTLLWRSNYPAGVTITSSTTCSDILTSNTYTGIIFGQCPIEWTGIVQFSGTMKDQNGNIIPPAPAPNYNNLFILQASSMDLGAVTSTGNAIPSNITFVVQYLDQNNNWITYNEPYFEAIERDVPRRALNVNQADFKNNEYENPLATGTLGAPPLGTGPMGEVYDPRTQRFSTPTTSYYTSEDPSTSNHCSSVAGNPGLETVLLSGYNTPSATQNQAVGSSNFVLMETSRPDTLRGLCYNYLNPCDGNNTSETVPYNSSMHWYASAQWNQGMNNGVDANFFGGLTSQNNFNQALLTASNQKTYQWYEDPDGVARCAMGAYVPISGTTTTSTVGLPLIASGSTTSNGCIVPSVQCESRPIILHRPFKNVAEMAYAFSGTPWKNIDFFTPESADTALLDVFSVHELPPSGVVAGKVNLNTHQLLVLQSILSGAYRDELSYSSTASISGNLTNPALSSAEAANIANTLIGITTGTQAWRGPLTNLADLVGHYVGSTAIAGISGTDYYLYTPTAGGGVYTYSGLSAGLSGSAGNPIWDAGGSGFYSNLNSSQYIQRFRESPIRALVDCGQTRVWNLMIDVIAQSGKYPPNLGASSPLSQFYVEGEKRYWIHVAIDRLTGQVIDRQIEPVTQ